jgi:CRP-like cAMP-binding protein/Na+/melibiose symporter-like transporter
MTVSSQTTKPSAFAVFRNRDFTLLWSAQLISTIGSALTSLAASILIFRITGSALSVGLMLIVTAAPSLILGLIAGVVVDRGNRKRIMFASDVIRAILVVLIPILTPHSIAWLYILVALSSVTAQFFNPAHESVIPEVASDEELAAANSFMAISSFGSTAIGFAASGLIASQFPIEWAFYLDGLTFLLSGICVLFIRIKPLDIVGETNVAAVWTNLREGAKFLFGNRILRSLLFVYIPVLIGLGLWNTLLLPFAERALNASEFEFGIQEGLTSVGFVIASFLMARMGDRLREGLWIALGFIGMAVLGMIYSRTASIPIAILLVAVIGFLNAPAAIARKLLVQRNTTREVRGRVNSVIFVTRDVLFLVGMAAAGFADLFDVRLLILVSSSLLLLGGIWVLLTPGLGRPSKEWHQSLRLLQEAMEGPAIGPGIPATLADLDTLTARLPALTRLDPADREPFIEGATRVEAPGGAIIIRKGDPSDDVFFILSGAAIAGILTAEGDLRALSTMAEGDFFGEIAALTGTPRTANVVTEESTTLLQVPAKNLKMLMDDPQLRYLFLSKLTERLGTTHVVDLPRIASLDQEALRELRTAPVERSTTGMDQ